MKSLVQRSALTKRTLFAVLVFSAALWAAFTASGALTAPNVVKLNPVGLGVEASGVWTDDAAAWSLFDRDTGTAYAPSTSPGRVMVTLPAATDISAVKVYGSASCNLAIYDGSSGAWVVVPGLDSIALKSQANVWDVFAPASELHTNKLMFEFTAAGGPAGGVKEIEIWGDDPGDPSLTLKGVKTATDAQAVLAVSPRPAHIVELDGAPQTIDVPADGSPYSVTFTSSFDPKLIKRAYILYDSFNAAYPVSPEKRINGLSWTGGFIPASSANPEWISQIEEINPSWLVKGGNTIDFRNRTTRADPSSYFIRNLKVVLELDNGWNLVSDASGSAENADHPAQMAIDGDLTTYFELKSSHTLDIKAERTMQPDALRINLWSAVSPMSGTITIQYFQGNQWKSFASGGTIDMSTLKGGWNDIKMPAVIATDTVRLDIQVTPDRRRPGATTGGINEIELTGSPIGPRPARGLVVDYPKAGEYFARTAYIQGFMDPAANSSGLAQISIEGKTVSNTDGAFGLALSRDETRFASQADSDPWEATVTATYPDGTNTAQTVALNRNLLPADPTDTGNSNDASPSKREKYSDKLVPGQAKKIQYKGVTLDIPAGAVDKETEITIIPLTEADLNRLNPGMINVTYADAGYRFLPHGMKFKQPIKISFGYSKTLFASGQVDDQVNMYYYDGSLLRWQQLSRVKVDPAVSQVTSSSDHFTDMINSTLVVPEHPEALTFNPNSLKDIKAADPAANIDLIEPPRADNKGAANLSYPLEIPKGRGAYTPDLRVTYSSSNTNGWMGLGWDVPVPSIQIDTRWGTPSYDPQNESESYLLAGQALAPVYKWNDDVKIQRTADRRFYKRVEGDFFKIIRKGGDPATYSWEVTDKSGVRYIYGQTAQARLADYKNGNVFQWFLEKVVDTNGNVTSYSYFTDTKQNYLNTHSGNPPQNSLNGENWTSVYLDKIAYAGNEKTGAAPPYTVAFLRDSGSRPDLIIGGKVGFKTAQRYRLDSVEVKFKGQTIRSYKFDYLIGDFSKSLLSKITYKGANDAVFYKHRFDYYTMPRSTNGNYAGFGAQESWAAPLSFDLLLTNNESHSSNRYRGQGPVPLKMLSWGKLTGSAHEESDTNSKLIDINGDGLPDLVYKTAANINQSIPGGAGGFNLPVGISGLSALEQEHRTTAHWGDAYYAVVASYSNDMAYTISNSSATMADINGDGFPDLVYGPGVLYNHVIEGKGFEANPSWSYTSSSDLSSLENETKQHLHLADAISKWTAPFDGDVRITGTVRKKAARIDKNEDGATLSIYKGNALIGSLYIRPDDTSVHLLGELAGNPGSDNIVLPGVNMNDRIYFRVNSFNNGDNDALLFDPVISYDASGGRSQQALQDLKDVYGRPLYSYQASADFTLADTQQSIWAAPYQGTMTLTGRITKLPTPDDVTVRIWRTANPDYSVWDPVLYSEYTFTANVTQTIELNETIDTVQAERFLVTVNSDRNIDPASVGVDVQAVYSAVNVCNFSSDPTKLSCSVQPVADQDAKGQDGTLLYRFRPAVNYPLTLMVPRASALTWTAPYDGTITINGGVVRSASSGAFTARILGINKSVWKQSVPSGLISQGDPAETYTPNVTLVVQQGDQLFFEVQSTAPLGSAVSWSPAITYTRYCPSGPASCAAVTCGPDPDTGVITCRPSGTQFIFNPDVQFSYADPGQGNEPFGGGFRQWYFGQWNGNNAWDETLIRKPAQDDDAALDAFVRMGPEPAGDSDSDGQPAWIAFENKCFVTAGEMASSRVAGNVDYSFTGKGIIRQSTGLNTSQGAGILVAGVQGSNGDTDTQIELLDFNGDRYPDQVTPGGVHLNDGRTGFKPQKYAVPGSFRSIHNWNAGFNVGVGTVVNGIGSDGKTLAQTLTSLANGGGSILDLLVVSFSAGFAEGTSTTRTDLIDINGDGLPDVVHQDSGNDGSVQVRLNLGNNRFGEEEAWALPVGSLSDSDIIRQQIRNNLIPLPFDKNPINTSENRTVNASLGLDLWGFAGFSGGMSLGVTRNEVAMIDVNGDGLPDQVMKYSFENFFRVKINQGGSFGPEERWTVPSWNMHDPDNNPFTDLLYRFGSLPYLAQYAGEGIFLANTMLTGNDTLASTTTTGGTYGWFYNLPIPLIPPNPFGIPPWFLIKGRENASGISSTVSQVEFVDIDGDGLPDHVFKGGALFSDVQVKRNLAGEVNLLKSVDRPLGGGFELFYTRTGNKVDYSVPGNIVDMPHSQWALTEVKLADGMKNTYETSYAYGPGFYSRAEREFYGFKSVTENRGAGGDAVTVVNTYDNQDYYRKGLLISSVTRAGGANVPIENRPIYVSTQNTYDATPGAVPDSLFPHLTRTGTDFYDVNAQTVAKSTSQEYTAYDSYGNVLEYLDRADDGTSDDVYASIRYNQSNDAEYIWNKPASIDVKDAGNTLYRHRSAVYENGTGNLLTLTIFVNQGTNAQWSMGYNPDGNIATITSPQGDPSHNKYTQGYQLAYAYDPDTATYVTGITDSFGYASSADYDLRFGQPVRSADVNGNSRVNDYDEFGRLIHVYGPYAVRGGSPACQPTIAFEYIAPGLNGENELATPARAVTTNRADSSAGCTGVVIKTATVSDGLKRIIQTRKDAEVNGAPTVVVSGKVIFDSLGRVKKQGQPVVGSGFAYQDLGIKHPTIFSYDTLDRTTSVTMPDGTVTTMIYRFENNLFLTQVIDPLRHAKESYKDVHDKIRAVTEHNLGQTITTTSYIYDILGQITNVTDARGNQTAITYDHAGNRLTINNPDTGLTKYTYDANGNVTTKETANLKRANKLIGYQYEYNRLIEVQYPDSPHVLYQYGAPTEAGDAKGNLAGRIKQVIDESGTELMYYGRLGETTKELRQINARNNPVNRILFETDYIFDSFGRMLSMTYPDGEVLSYVYNTGGLLKQAYGMKRANRYDYVKTLLYDEFGQRTKLVYGNNVATNYTYEPLMRRLKHLRTVEPTKGRVIQDVNYNYDPMGNILDIANLAPVPTGGEIGGPTEHHYTYDDLYQLTTANGYHIPAPGKKTIYTNAINYDTIGNITRKLQTHLIVGTNSSQQPAETNYDLWYKYTGIQPHAVTDAGDKLYTYDSNGNMLGWTSKTTNASRIITWNEENRVKNIADSGNGTSFLYDDAGERVVKGGGGNETVYVNRFYAVKNGDLGTKHVFVGETRVTTKLEKDGGSIQSGVPGANAFNVSQGLQNALNQGNPSAPKKGINRRLPGSGTGTASGSPPIEKFEFFYHGDHLGSSNFITDDLGAVYQDLEYFPYGETWVEDGGSGQMPMYRFTGKELDPETGLYYFGARYYDPVLSRWISADPIFGKYLPTGDREKDKNLPGYGGVYRPINLNLYTYSYQNPIKYLDPDGKVGLLLQYEAKLAAGAPVGNRDVSAIVTTSTTKGLVWDPVGGTLYSTNFVSYGAYAAAQLDTEYSEEYVLGGYVGAGANIVLTNAKVPSKDLVGITPTTFFNLDLGTRSISLSFGEDENGIWAFSLGAPETGPGLGIALGTVNMKTGEVNETAIFKARGPQAGIGSSAQTNNTTLNILNHRMPDPSVMNCHARE